MPGVQRQSGAHQQRRCQVGLKPKPQPWPLPVGLQKHEQIRPDQQPQCLVDSSSHGAYLISGQHPHGLELVQVGVQFDTGLHVKSVL